MHHRGENQKPIRPKHSMDFIDRFLRIRKMFKGFEVQYQSDALIRNWFHISNITDNVNAGWIKVPHILLDILFPWKEGLIKIRFPSSAGIKDGLLKVETCNGPFYIVDNRFSQSDLLSPPWGFSIARVKIENRRGAQA
jgi:hypothetical protein